MMSAPDKPIRVVIVDDHRLVREGVRALLTTSPRVDVVGEGADGHDAIRLIASHDPDILMMDVSMPRMSGLEAMREIGRQGARSASTITRNMLLMSCGQGPAVIS